MKFKKRREEFMGGERNEVITLWYQKINQCLKRICNYIQYTWHSVCPNVCIVYTARFGEEYRENCGQAFVEIGSVMKQKLH